MTLEKLVVIITAETKQLEKAIDRVKSQLSSLESVAGKIGTKLTKSFSKSASGFGKITKRLGLVGLTAGFISLGKSAIDAASDLQEWQNVVEVAFGDATDQVNQFGKIAIKQFGLSELSAKKLAGNFMAMADGIGLSNEAGAKMAIQLSGLAADMASFFNTTTEATQVALQGIFTNQTRALKQYGVVMTEANLEAFRMARGIQTAYSQMSEAQRVALRYNYVLQATANAHNDYARTAMTWANQMRLLSNNWKQLITSVGNGLVQLLTPVVAILNKILTMAIAVVNAIAKVFGGKGISGVSSGGSSPIGGLADDASDLGDNLDDATGSAKKFKATIAGFDELETLNPQPSDSGGGAGGAGAGGVDVGDLDSYFDFMEEDGLLGKFEDFMKKLKALMDAGDWEGVGKEIAGVLNKLMYWLDDWILKFDEWGTKWATITARILNGVVEAFDWEFFGKLIADGLNAVIHICNAFLETFNALALGEGIGRAVNSWFTNVDWVGIGHFFANNLNFFIDIVAGFFDKFINQAYITPQKLGEAFNAFIDWIHWDNLSRAIWEGLNSLAQTIQGFVDMVDWENLKTKVSTALSNIFDNLDIESIKKAIADLVNNIMDFLTSIDWYQIGHTVGEMLSGVDWLGVLKDVKDQIIWPAFKGFWDGLMSDGKNYILGFIGKITSWFKESFWGPVAATIFGMVGTNIILGALRGFFSNTSGHLLTELARSATYVIGSIGGLVPGWGNEVTHLFDTAFGINGSTTMALGTSIKFTGFKIAKTFGEWGEGIKTAIIGLANKVVGWFGPLQTAMIGGSESITTFGSACSTLAGPVAIAVAAIASLCSSYGGLGGVIERVGKVFGDAIKGMKDFANSIGFSDKIDRLKKSLSNMVEPLKKIYDALGKLKPVWEVVFVTLSAVIEVALNAIVAAIGALVDVISGLANIIGGALDVVVGIVTLNGELIVKGFKLMGEGIVGVFKGLWDGIVNLVKGIVQAVVDWFKNLKYQLVGDPIVIDMVNDIIQVFTQFVSDAVAVFEGFVEMITGIFQAIWDALVVIMNGIKEFLFLTWEAIKNFAIEVWTNIKNFIYEMWMAISTDTTDIWTVIHEFLDKMYETITNLVKTVWENLHNLIETWWNTIKNTTERIWNAIKTWLIDLFNLLKNTINRWMETVKTTISNGWTNVKNKTSEIWNNIKTFITDAWNSINNKAREITDSIREKWVNAYTKITDQWSKFKSFWSGVWEGIADTAKTALNAVIRQLNRFSFSIPSWVPFVGGRSFQMDIPYLANGGIIDNPTVAMLGEYSGAKSNPEIATPQSLLQEIIAEGNNDLIDVWVQTTRQIIEAIDGVDVSVAIGDEQIAQSANRGNNAYKQRTGKPLFSL